MFENLKRRIATIWANAWTAIRNRRRTVYTVLHDAYFHMYDWLKSLRTNITQGAVSARSNSLTALNFTWTITIFGLLPLIGIALMLNRHPFWIVLIPIVWYVLLLGLAYILSLASVMFTTLKEGTAKGILIGTRAYKIILGQRGFYSNDPWSIWFRPEYPPWERLPKSERPSFFEALSLFRRFHNGNVRLNWRLLLQLPFMPLLLILKSFELFGLYFIGPLPLLFSVYVRKDWRWGEWEQGDDLHQKILVRTETTNFIFVFSFTYAFFMQGVEAKGGLPLDVRYSVIVETNNPFKALFLGGDDWLIRVTTDLNAAVKLFIGARGPEQLINTAPGATGPDGDLKVSFTEEVLKLNDELPGIVPKQGLKNIRGITFVDARLESIEPSGTEAEKRDRALLWMTRYTAEEQGRAKVITAEATRDATIAEAEGIKQATTLKGEGDAAAVQAMTTALSQRMETAAKHGDTARVVLGFETLERSAGKGTTFIWGTSPFPGAFPQSLPPVPPAKPADPQQPQATEPPTTKP